MEQVTPAANSDAFLRVEEAALRARESCSTGDAVLPFVDLASILASHAAMRAEMCALLEENAALKAKNSALEAQLLAIKHILEIR